MQYYMKARWVSSVMSLQLNKSRNRFRRKVRIVKNMRCFKICTSAKSNMSRKQDNFSERTLSFSTGNPNPVRVNLLAIHCKIWE